MIGVGVVGYGYWGPNLVRNFMNHDGARVVGVCDMDPKRLALVERRHPGVRAVCEMERLLEDPEVHAIVIATPVSTHFPLAMAALQAGKHVLVEKPITQTSSDAVTLIAEARARGLVLMVDHTFVYTGAVRKIRELIDSGAIGDVLYYDSVRINLGLFQRDVNVLWDLAVHDLSILDHLRERPVRSVSATGLSHVNGRPENIAYITLHFDDPFLAHCHVNWLAPVKIRQTLIAGTSRMIVYNDLEPSEKVKIYDKGIDLTDDPQAVHEMLVGYRTGDVWIPKVDTTEALETETAHFLDCVSTGRRPITDGESGLRVLRILEAAGRSMKSRGNPEEVPDA